MMVMAAIETDDTSRIETDDPQRPPRRSREAAFQRARNHSRAVRLLKVALPSLAAAMALGFFGHTYMSAPPSVDIKVAGTAISNGKLVMTSPRLAGVTKDNLSYLMTASRALQNLDSTGIIELEDIKAKLPVDTKNWATIDAPRGAYDRDKNTLDIASNITVTTTDGMVAKLKSAFVDVGKGNLKTDDAVEISAQGHQNLRRFNERA